MKLSERQVRIVNAFLRECAADTRGGPEAARTQTVTRIRRQLRDELAQRDDTALRDDELIRLLNRIQFPDRAAMADAAVQSRPPDAPPATNGNSAFVPAIAPASIEVAPPPESKAAPAQTPSKPQRAVRLPSGPLASSQRVWLGECIALAEQIDQPIGRVRVAFLVAGLLTGPIAVIAYLAGYATSYLGKHGPGAPIADPRRVLRSVSEPAAILAVMALVFSGGRWAIDRVFEMVVGNLPDLGQWESLTGSVGSLLFAAAAATLPIAALAGLPVAPPWDVNLPRLVRIALACVAGILALGLASYLAGALIDAAQNWSG